MSHSKLDPIKNTDYLYGFRAVIKNNDALLKVEESIKNDKFHFHLHDGLIDIEYINEKDRENVIEVLDRYINTWALVHNCFIKYEIDLTWEKRNGKKFIQIQFCDTIKFSESVTISSFITGKARIVSKLYNSLSLFNNDLSKKVWHSETLEEAIFIYNNEVLGSTNFLPGVYRVIDAIEEFIKVQYPDKQWIEILSKLINKDISYIKNIKESTQWKRHFFTLARKSISPDECKERVRFILVTLVKNLQYEIKLDSSPS